MYLVQYKEICEKQGWKFEFCDGDLNVRITLPSLPSKPFFTVSKENFAENITALSDNHLLDEYAKITSTASTTGQPISLSPIFNEGFAVSAALNALAAALNSSKIEAQTWVCTDPDTCQWRRQIGETKFELYDTFKAPDGCYTAHGIVDPAKDLKPYEVENLTKFYDGLLDDVTSDSERWALLAEAQFEMEEFSTERRFYTSFEDAEAYIHAVVENDNSKLPKPKPDDENDELWKLSEALYARDVVNGVVKTRLDTIRSLDKLRLAIFLQDVHSHAKDYPTDNLSWCDWLSKADDGQLLDVKSVSL
jgi:hypothetical protein